MSPSPRTYAPDGDIELFLQVSLQESIIGNVSLSTSHVVATFFGRNLYYSTVLRIWREIQTQILNSDWCYANDGGALFEEQICLFFSDVMFVPSY